MTPEEINAAIAEAVGYDLHVIVKRDLYYRPDAAGYTGSMADAWKLPKEKAKKYEMYADRVDVPGCEKVLIKPASIPNYCGDLNAMSEAEKHLNFHRFVEGAQEPHSQTYWSRLLYVATRDKTELHCATAAHRAEAFLRAIGKWKEAAP